jgi:hypothetical protein
MVHREKVVSQIRSLVHAKTRFLSSKNAKPEFASQRKSGSPRLGGLRSAEPTDLFMV